ncbi:hypothetical protein BVX94_01600, partial [bacterium B17]
PHLTRALLQNFILLEGHNPEYRRLLNDLVACVPTKLENTEEIERKLHYQAEQLGETKTKRHFAHELNTPLAALHGERNNMSGKGQLALDYITLWQRFAGNALAERELPESIQRLFLSDMEFIKNVVLLSLMRVNQESKIPSIYTEGEYVCLTSKELMDNLDRWLVKHELSLDPAYKWISANLPVDAAIQCKRMVQTLILSLSIGAFHHLLEYVFSGNNQLNDDLDDIFVHCHKACFSICAEKDHDTMKLCVVNTGTDSDLTDGQLLSSQKFGSNRIGVTKWKFPGEYVITLIPFTKKKSNDDGSAIWQAEVVLRKEVKNA